ncbi:hypothetical protein GCM10017688_02510 [Streptomyces ramulosus]
MPAFLVGEAGGDRKDPQLRPDLGVSGEVARIHLLPRRAALSSLFSPLAPALDQESRGEGNGGPHKRSKQ